jgi:peptide deformylase
MSILPLIYAPHPIFKMKAEPVEDINDDIRKIVTDMFSTMYIENAVGLGANMVGILKRIAVVDLQENNIKSPLTFINPIITWRSDNMQTYKEASLCFPGISAEINRPSAIKINYFDYDGKAQELKAEGFLSTVIQHEVDYLDGKVFLDYLSKMKRDILIRKVEKHIKKHPPHVHGKHCNH